MEERRKKNGNCIIRCVWNRQIYNREKDENRSAEQYIKGLLHIPEHLRVLCAIAIGYKDEERKPYDIEKLAYDKIHFQK